MLLTIEPDSVLYEGTQRAVLKIQIPAGAGQLQANEPTYALLRCGERCCGVMIDQIEAGRDSICLDSYLRIFLQARVGDQISVEITRFSAAKRVELIAPTETSHGDLLNMVRDIVFDKPLTSGMAIPLWVAALTGEQLIGEVMKVYPDEIGIVTSSTEIFLTPGKVSQDGVTYDHIGGLGPEIQRIREIVEYPLRHPNVFQRLGILPPRGVILYGPPGTGKTLIAKALAHEVGATVCSIQGPEIISGWYGGSEQNLRNIFDQARMQSPAIILIDELDSIAPRRDHTQGEVEHRVVASLLTLMDGLSDMQDVVVIGTTNTVNSIDSALRRPGRFDYEIHIGVPDARGRKEILDIHTRRMPLAKDGMDFNHLAEKTHGFVGADIALLCRQAAYNALRRVWGETGENLGAIKDVSAVSITALDFENALPTVKPSAMREVMVEIPMDASWDNIGGLEEAKKLLIENVVYGIQHREIYNQVGIKPAKGLLLYGPPGTGKTLLARAAAREAGANFITIRGPEVRSKYFGESEEKIRFIFAKAREVAPCVILFDEIDATAPTRGRDLSGVSDSIVNQLLTEMDGIEKNDQVFIIGTTNRSELIDPALLRPGRFDYQIRVPHPDAQGRQNIFQVHLRGKPAVEDLSLERLASITQDMSGADIAEICRLATLDALRAANFEPGSVHLTMAMFENVVNGKKQTKTDFGL